jgi:hypothetical protein
VLPSALGPGTEEDLEGGAGEEGLDADRAEADEEVCERIARVITAMTATSPTRRSRRIPRAVVRADGVRVMRPVKAA